MAVVPLLRLLRLPIAVFLLVLAGLIAVSCGDDDSSDPASQPTGGTASGYPVTVTDRLGRAVEVPARPARIVALSPTAAEFVYALDGELVGRASSVQFPAAALEADEIGTAYQPNLEMILSLNPDLVVADDVVQAQPGLREALIGLPAPVIFVGVESYQDVLEGLRIMGDLLDAAEKAEAVVKEVEQARDGALAKLEGMDVSALVLIGDRDQTLYGAKDASYIGDLLKQLGIANPASVQPDSGPFPGYTTIAPEKLIEYDPDFIFAITPAPPPVPRLSEQIRAIPPFRGLTAVTQQHVIEAPVETFLQAPGPRVVDVFEAIVSAVEGSPAAARASGK